MQAGRLRHRLTFVTLPSGATSTVWGSLDYEGGRTHSVTIRAKDFDRTNLAQVMDDVTTKIHMTHGSRVFDLDPEQIDQDARHFGRVTLTVEERVDSSE